MASRSSANPIENISSASSSTTVWTRERSTAPCPTRSTSRPGVATTTSTPRRSRLICFPYGWPPRDRQRPHAERAAVGVDGARDLDGELARRAQDEGLDRPARRVRHPVEERGARRRPSCPSRCGPGRWRRGRRGGSGRGPPGSGRARRSPGRRPSGRGRGGDRGRRTSWRDRPARGGRCEGAASAWGSPGIERVRGRFRHASRAPIPPAAPSRAARAPLIVAWLLPSRALPGRRSRMVPTGVGYRPAPPAVRGPGDERAKTLCGRGGRGRGERGRGGRTAPPVCSPTAALRGDQTVPLVKGRAVRFCRFAPPLSS